MFNRTVIQAHHHHHADPGDIEVHEHRAPTDESIRLAQEYQDKAWAKVKRKVVEDIKGIDAQLVRVEHLYFDDKVVILFKINGIPHEAMVDQNQMDGTQQAIAKAIAESITNAIITGIQYRRTPTLRLTR